MKIRILNGGHASLCYAAALLGIKYVHEAMQHPTIAQFLDCLEQFEIIPTVPPVPDTCLKKYWELIAKRFSNPTINDAITRVCFGGSNNQPKFIVPIVRDALQGGIKVDGLALVSAMWCKYCQGKTEAGVAIASNDPQWNRLQAVAKAASQDPKAWLQMADVYGEVGEDSSFIEAFSSALHVIEVNGIENAMFQYIQQANKRKV